LIPSSLMWMVRYGYSTYRAATSRCIRHFHFIPTTACRGSEKEVIDLINVFTLEAVAVIGVFCYACMKCLICIWCLETNIEGVTKLLYRCSTGITFSGNLRFRKTIHLRKYHIGMKNTSSGTHANNLMYNNTLLWPKSYGRNFIIFESNVSL
jgi:hypothetical protein